VSPDGSPVPMRRMCWCMPVLVDRQSLYDWGIIWYGRLMAGAGVEFGTLLLRHHISPMQDRAPTELCGLRR
jgi:hypothetical protein